MKIRVPSYFKDFKCIAAACEDTCCAGWEVVIDDEAYDSYQHTESAFGEKIRSLIAKDENGDHIFVLKGENCPFLDEQKLCEIYKELGEKSLCYTCRQYPRYMEAFFDLREMGISLSCPEAARIILRNSKPTAFELSEDDEVGDGDDSMGEGVVEDFLLCRDLIINIIEMTHLSLETKMAIVLKFGEEIQELIDFDEMDEIKHLINKYNKRDFINELVKALDQYKENENIKYNHVYEYFKTYQALEHINANDPLGLDNALSHFEKSEEAKLIFIEKHTVFDNYYRDNMYKFKNIVVYFIFRYFMKAVYDYDVSSKIKLAIISTLMIKELAVVRWIEKGQFTEEDMVDISHMYSKDIEHLEENIETLQEIFETEEVYEVEKIIRTLIK